MKRIALQLYRMGLVCAVAWLVRDLALRQRIQGDAPARAEEVKEFLPDAALLRPDDSARDGLFVLDREGRELGYVVRTQPRCRDIIGYCGLTDVLVVFDRNWTILGLKVHASDDTQEHVDNVTLDRRFLKKWNGMTWDAAAEMDLKKAGIEGVSGATMTSMAMAQSVKARLKSSRDEIIARPPLRLHWRDWGMLGVLGAAGVMAFGKPAWRHRWKRVYQFSLIIYVGLIAGDLLALKLFSGWLRSGVPWTTAPALALLAIAALLVPWTTRQPFYCHHICPHGAAQELLTHFFSKRRRWLVPAEVARGLEFLPLGLLLLTLVVTMLALPLDLAGIEPFDAYLVRTAGVATLAVAGLGLLASFFVPQAYCRFGCPTGALLNFVRGRGPTDGFSRRDGVALLFLALAVALNWKYPAVSSLLRGMP